MPQSPTVQTSITPNHRNTLSLDAERDASRTVIIRETRRGGFLRPIGQAIALSIFIAFCAWFGTSYWIGAERLYQFTKAVHHDASVIIFPKRTPLKLGETEILLKNANGETVRVAANRTALKEFEKEMIFYLKHSEDKANDLFKADISAAFDKGFKDSEDDLQRYADWYFEWKRSWIILYEMLKSAVVEIPKAFSPEQTWDAVQRTTETYLMRHYKQFVLKPETRNPVLEREIGKAFERAHQHYLTIVAEMDSRQQKFLAKHTRHLETIRSDDVKVTLDWKAQVWKTPRHYAGDKSVEAFGSTGLIAASALVTRTALGPVLNRVNGRIFSGLATRVVTANAATIQGAFAGTVVEPVLGTAIGVAGGAAIDWGLSKINKSMSEDDFMNENRKALTATREQWQEAVNSELSKGVSLWYSDLRQVVAVAPPSSEEI